MPAVVFQFFVNLILYFLKIITKCLKKFSSFYTNLILKKMLLDIDFEVFSKPSKNGKKKEKKTKGVEK